MRVIKFPYTVHRGIALPYIPLSVKIGKTWRRFWTFVDSGSTFSIFKASEIKDMDFDYKSGKLFNVQVGNGGFIPIYAHKLELILDNFRFSATIGFSEKLGVEFNLLGRKDIFEIFDVTFSDSKRKLTFTFVTKILLPIPCLVIPSI